MSSANGSEAGSARAREAEALLRSLHGVILARIATDAHGHVHEIRVLVEDDATPELVARDVQSALLARFGTFVDLGSIHVAPLPGGTRSLDARNGNSLAAATREPARATRPGEASVTGRRAEPPLAGRGAVDTRTERDGPNTLPRLESLEIERGFDQRVRCTLTLLWNDRRLEGEAATLDDGGNARLEVAARAVLAALDAQGDGPPLELEGARLCEIAGRAYVTTALRAHLGRAVRYGAGAAPIEHSAEDAAAYAALQAAAPWLATTDTVTRRTTAGV